jgi:hypothetical protein
MFDSDDAVKDAKALIDMLVKEKPNPPWTMSTDIAHEDISIATVFTRVMPALVAILQVAQSHFETEGGITLTLTVEPIERDEEEVLQ